MTLKGVITIIGLLATGFCFAVLVFNACVWITDFIERRKHGRD